MRISRDFSDHELVVTDHAGFAIAPESMPYYALIMCARLVHALPQPVRSYFARPVIIHSFYRHPVLNERVGGASDSRHKCLTQDGYFAACDFHVAGVDASEVFVKIARGDLLCEFDRLCLYVHENRLHGDIREDDNRKLFYTDSGAGWEPLTREAAGEL